MARADQTVKDRWLAAALKERIARAPSNGGRLFSVREQKVNEYLTALGERADDKAKPRLIREESADEGWTVTPIGHRPGDPIPDDFDPFEEDEDENNDTSFYTREDYENTPILRQILIDLGDDDPLADE